MPQIQRVTIGICDGEFAFDGSDTLIRPKKLGAPHDTGGTFRKSKRPHILVYDNVEFHFDTVHRLCLIYQDREAFVRLSIPFEVIDS